METMTDLESTFGEESITSILSEASFAKVKSNVEDGCVGAGDSTGSMVSAMSSSRKSQYIRVCVRFRPMNKFETHHRSHNCIDIDESESCLTINSPLDGERDFKFNKIYDENATQAQVYEDVGSPLVENLLKGYNCSLIAYGLTGTGKSYTMRGLRTDLSKDTILDPNNSIPQEDCQIHSAIRNDIQNQNEKVTETSGMVQRVTRDIFKGLDKSRPTGAVEITVRCSYVRLYMEKIIDLLNPAATNLIVVESLSEEKGGNAVYIEGVSEACCLDENDVTSIISQGNAFWATICKKHNTASAYSHSIVTFVIEQKDVVTGNTLISRLQLVDLGGSDTEVKTPTQSTQNDSIYKGMSSLKSVVRALVEKKRKSSARKSNISGINMRSNRGVPYRSSKLTHLLRLAIGGDSFSTIILTASPSSYHIHSTMTDTLLFGQRVQRIKNRPVVNKYLSTLEYRKELLEAEKKLKDVEMDRCDLRNILHELTLECHKLRDEGKKGKLDDNLCSGPLWEKIDEIVEQKQNDAVTGDDAELNTISGYFTRIHKDRDYSENKIKALKADLIATKKSRNIAESGLGEIKAEMNVLKNKYEILSLENTKNIQAIRNGKIEMGMLTSQILEHEANSRTFQFRANEATLFLRHYRRFYRRLLKNKSTNSMGDVADIVAKVKGDTNDIANKLMDIDKTLYDSGLIEDCGDDDTIVGPFGATPSAFERSKVIALSNERNNTAVVNKENDSSLIKPQSGGETTGDSFSSNNDIGPKVSYDNQHKSNTHNLGVGDNEEDPSGYSQNGNLNDGISSREMEVIKDLQNMNEKFIQLQISLNYEREKVDLLTNRSGSLNQKQLSRQVISLRAELEQKHHNLELIVWKLNELNMVNMAHKEKETNLLRYSRHVEECLINIRKGHQQLMKQREDNEENLKKELEALRAVDGCTKNISLWQFFEMQLDSISKRRMKRWAVPITIFPERIVDSDDESSFTTSASKTSKVRFKNEDEEIKI